MGVYFHIPFCRHACHYCDFHFSTKLDAQEDLVVAMLKEMELRKEEIIQHEINKIAVEQNLCIGICAIMQPVRSLHALEPTTPLLMSKPAMYE